MQQTPVNPITAALRIRFASLKARTETLIATPYGETYEGSREAAFVRPLNCIIEQADRFEAPGIAKEARILLARFYIHNAGHPDPKHHYPMRFEEISKLVKTAGVTLESLGTSQEKLDQLKKSCFIASQRQTLAQAKESGNEPNRFKQILEELEKGNITEDELGETTEQIRQLMKKSAWRQKSGELQELAVSGHPCYGIENFFDRYGITAEEMSDKGYSPEHLAKKRRGFHLIQAQDAFAFGIYNRMRSHMEQCGLTPEDIGTTELEITKRQEMAAAATALEETLIEANGILAELRNGNTKNYPRLQALIAQGVNLESLGTSQAEMDAINAAINEKIPE